MLLRHPRSAKTDQVVRSNYTFAMTIGSDWECHFAFSQRPMISTNTGARTSTPPPFVRPSAQLSGSKAYTEPCGGVMQLFRSMVFTPRIIPAQMVVFSKS